MEQFKDYLVSEYKVDGAVATELKFSHNMTVKIDKTSNIPLNVHTITVALKFYDKDLKLLKSASVKFVNNELTKCCAKKLVNISPDELTNKFMQVRPLIIDSIMSEYKQKLLDIEDKLRSLFTYKGVADEDITIDDTFKGELIQVNEEKPKPKKRVSYEM